MQRAMAAAQNKFPWLLLVASVAAFFAGLPVLASAIRELEPGRNKPPDQVAGPEVPKEGAFITAHCPEPCRLGSYVKLVVGRTDKPSYLYAYAEDEALHRVWYYPTQSGTLPLIDPHADIVVLSEAIKLSDEHKVGREWTLHLYLLQEPTERGAPIKDPIASKALKLVLGEGR
jgi:hypothetical protein